MRSPCMGGMRWGQMRECVPSRIPSTTACRASFARRRGHLPVGEAGKEACVREARRASGGVRRWRRYVGIDYCLHGKRAARFRGPAILLGFCILTTDY